MQESFAFLCIPVLGDRFRTFTRSFTNYLKPQLQPFWGGGVKEHSPQIPTHSHKSSAGFRRGEDATRPLCPGNCFASPLPWSSHPDKCAECGDREKERECEPDGPSGGFVPAPALSPSLLKPTRLTQTQTGEHSSRAYSIGTECAFVYLQKSEFQTQW